MIPIRTLIGLFILFLISHVCFCAQDIKFELTGVICDSQQRIIIGGNRIENKIPQFFVGRYGITGLPDTTFNGTGKNWLLLGTQCEAHAISIGTNTYQDQPMIGGLAQGTENYSCAFSRWKTNGQLDVSRTQDITSTTWSSINAMNGLGITGSGVINGAHVLMTARLTTQGTLDTSFNPSGIQPGVVLTKIGGNSMGNTVIHQTDNKIVVAGWTNLNNAEQIFLARYNANGTFDNNFGGQVTGITHPLNVNSCHPTGLVQLADGKLVVVGYTIYGNTTKMLLARYMANGTLDTSFCGTGYLTQIFGGNGQLNAIAVQADGKIIVGGWSNDGEQDNLFIARYTTAGVLDPTFGSGGYTILTLSTKSKINALTVQPDGAIVVAGTYGVNGLLARFTTQGILDKTFGTKGMVVISDVPVGYYFFAYNTGIQLATSPNSYSDIYFDTNSSHDGWSHEAGTAEFVCGKRGTYMIKYNISVDSLSPIDGSISVRAVNENIPIDGSQVSVSNNPNQTVNQSFLCTCNPGDIIKLQFSVTDIDIQLVPSGDVSDGTVRPSASISISKIA